VIFYFPNLRLKIGKNSFADFLVIFYFPNLRLKIGKNSFADFFC